MLQFAHDLGYGVVGMLLFFAGGGVFFPFLGGVGRGLLVHREGRIDGQQHVQFVLARAAVAAGEGKQGGRCGGGVDGDQDGAGHAGSLMYLGGWGGLFA
ncbi:hypothetical protein D9M73_263180 [compost metagenome]